MSNAKSRNGTPPNIAGLVAISLSVGLFVYLSIVMSTNDRLEDDLKQEKLTSELLLSEKLSLEKTNLKLKEVVLVSENASKIYSERLNNTLGKLSQAESERKKERMKSVPSLLVKQQKDELERLRRKGENDSIENAGPLVLLRSENIALEQSLGAQINQTKRQGEELDRLRLSLMNEISIESARRNKRLTTRAAKTKSIMITAAVSATIENVTFRIIDPKGKELVLNKNNSSVKLIKGSVGLKAKAFYVNPEIELGDTEKYQQVQMVYTAESTLVPGAYKIFLYSENKPIGNLRLRLE